MPTISQRGIDMPASPIRKLVPLANRAKAKGTVVYHLNIGQPDLATPEVALRAAHHLDREVLEYSPSEGILSFRKKLVEYYHKFNIDVCTDDIIFTAGSGTMISSPGSRQAINEKNTASDPPVVMMISSVQTSILNLW